jgi:hypothetical protein
VPQPGNKSSGYTRCKGLENAGLGIGLSGCRETIDDGVIIHKKEILRNGSWAVKVKALWLQQIPINHPASTKPGYKSYCLRPFQPIAVMKTFSCSRQHRISSGRRLMGWDGQNDGICQGFAMNLDTLLRIMVSKGASDLHLKVGCFPHIRVNGELVPLGDQGKLDKEDSLMMAFSIMNNKQKERFRDAAEVDIGYGVRGLGRFRVNVFQQRGNVSVAIRAIPTNILRFDDLHLPRILETISKEPRGLVLVTGTTGSGKSTTIASMINFIYASYHYH